MAAAALTSILGGLDKAQIGFAGVNTALNLAKGIWGATQAAKGSKELNQLLSNPVTYKRPEEYFADLQAQQQRAGMTKMPGQGYAEQNIGQAYSQAIGNLEKGAISSNVYQRGVGDLYQKTLNAYQDLARQSAQWQDQQQQNLSQARQRGMAYSDQEWQQNVLYPWELKANMARDKIQAGGQNMSSGLQGAMGSISDFIGTQYYNTMLKQMMGGNQGGQQPVTQGTQQFMDSTSPDLLYKNQLNKPQGFLG